MRPETDIVVGPGPAWPGLGPRHMVNTRQIDSVQSESDVGDVGQMTKAATPPLLFEICDPLCLLPLPLCVCVCARCFLTHFQLGV